MSQAELTPPTPEVTADPNAPITVESLDHFARLMAQWHMGRVAQLKHILTVPEGIQFTVGEEVLILQGDVLKGFKFGVELALIQFKELPFAFETEDAPTATPAAEEQKAGG